MDVNQITRNLERAITNLDTGHNRRADLGHGIEAVGENGYSISLKYTHNGSIYTSTVARYRNGWTIDKKAVAAFCAAISLL
jgi:hypothetical protein